MKGAISLLLLVQVARAWAGGEVEFWRDGPDADGQGARCPGAGWVLMGGGGDVDDAFRWLRDRSGGGDVVVLRSTGGDGYQDYLWKTIGGFRSVTTLALRERSGAFRSEVEARLTQAEAIFIAGGDQARYINDWVGTPVQTALQQHVEAGRPIGGTSAGLAILGGISFHALCDTISSEEALNNPFDSRITLGLGIVDAPLMRGVLTDTHFNERGRQGRLAVFLARAAGLSSSPVVGLGVDEATAVCVEANGIGTVMSARHGSAWVLRLVEAAVIEKGRPFSGRCSATRVAVGGTIRFPALSAKGEQTTLIYGDELRR